MYEFQEIDGGWRIFWGPPAKTEENNPTPPDKAVILPFVQIEASTELEYAVAA